MKRLSKHTVLFLCLSIIVFGSLFACLLFLAQPFRVVGESMLPSYQHNDLVFANTLSDSYSTNDVVILRYGKEKIIKRIYAVQGDVVELRADGVYINKIFITCNSNKYEKVKYLLGESEYFVLGDNYEQSIDSRYFGVINQDEILGKVIYEWNNG